MIAALALAAVAAAPPRDALIARWLHANHMHRVASLESPVHETAPPTDLAALAQRELAVPGRYRLTESAPLPEEDPWWARMLRWIGDRWNDLWSAIARRVHVTAGQAEGVGDGLLALVVLGLLFIAYRILLNIRIARDMTRAEAEPIAAPPTPRALYRLACATASNGDYGEAVLVLFAATVALLGARSSATVGDVRRDLRGRQAVLMPQFDTVAAPFVRRAYAERAIGVQDWNRAQASFIALKSAAERPVSKGQNE